MGFWGCQAGIGKDLPCTCMSQAAPPRHCLPSLRHGSYLAPLSSATARGPTFILLMKNHVKDHLSTYNRKTHYIFCLTEYSVLCATHTTWIPSLFTHIIRNANWWLCPMHHIASHPSPFAPLQPPPTTASSTHHCNTETTMPKPHRTFSRTGQPTLQYSHINMEWYKNTIKFLARDILCHKLSQDLTNIDKRLRCGTFNQILKQNFEIWFPFIIFKTFVQMLLVFCRCRSTTEYCIYRGLQHSLSELQK
jgi:hypothetical protein